MQQQWHRYIEAFSPEHAGIILDAMQRYLQFDTVAGVVPYDAIDLLFTPERLKHIAEQAVNFCTKFHETLSPMPQNMKEEAVRAHLAGIINLPVPSSDLWHGSFKQLHLQNRARYDALGTAARVEALLGEIPGGDVMASALSKHLGDHGIDYTPAGLIDWTIRALQFYNANAQRLGRYSAKEQRAIIASHLGGKTDIAW